MGGDGEAVGGRAFILQNFQGEKKIKNISLVYYNFFLGGRAFILQNFQGLKKIEYNSFIQPAR